MLHFYRPASIKGAPLILVALLAWVTPAGAVAGANALSANALSANAVARSGVPAKAGMTTGSALGDLNGVAVEAVIIQDAATR